MRRQACSQGEPSADSAAAGARSDCADSVAPSSRDSAAAGLQPGMAQFHFQRAPMPLPLQGLRRRRAPGGPSAIQALPFQTVPLASARLTMPSGGAASSSQRAGSADSAASSAATEPRARERPRRDGGGKAIRTPVRRRRERDAAVDQARQRAAMGIGGALQFRAGHRQAPVAAGAVEPVHQHRRRRLTRSGPARVICLRPAPASIARPTGRAQAGGQLLGGGHGAGGGGGAAAQQVGLGGQVGHLRGLGAASAARRGIDSESSTAARSAASRPARRPARRRRTGPGGVRVAPAPASLGGRGGRQGVALLAGAPGCVSLSIRFMVGRA